MNAPSRLLLDPIEDTNARVVCCTVCGSEGVLTYSTSYMDEYGNPMERVERCDACEGTGGEVIETQPIDQQDIEELNQAQWWNETYLPNVRKALRGEHVDRALLEGGTAEANEDQNWDSKTGEDWS